VDHSIKNYKDKKRIFNHLNNLHIVTPSKWLENHVKNSFLKDYPVHTIHNGIDTQRFIPKDDAEIRKKYQLVDYKIILGLASTWKKRKALDDFIQLSNHIKSDEKIVLVGIYNKLAKGLPLNIMPVERTESIDELASIYSAASVFVNPTYADNFPSTNIEALSCGTPVITYNTGGSSESIDQHTGMVVKRGDLMALSSAVRTLLDSNVVNYKIRCRSRAILLFDKTSMFDKYISLYRSII